MIYRNEHNLGYSISWMGEYNKVEEFYYWLFAKILEDMFDADNSLYWEIRKDYIVIDSERIRDLYNHMDYLISFLEKYKLISYFEIDHDTNKEIGIKRKDFLYVELNKEYRNEKNINMLKALLRLQGFEGKTNGKRNYI